MLGEYYCPTLKVILPNNILLRYTESLSVDIMEQLLTRIIFSPKFASRVDELTYTVALQ